MPDKMPVQCALDQKKLDNIESTVMKMSDQLDDLTDMSGPIADHEKRIVLVEESAVRAHKRIDTVEEQQKTDHDTLTHWIGRAVAGLAVAILAIELMLKYVLP